MKFHTHFRRFFYLNRITKLENRAEINVSILIRQITSSLICHHKTDFYQVDFCLRLLHKPFFCII